MDLGDKEWQPAQLTRRLGWQRPLSQLAKARQLQAYRKGHLLIANGLIVNGQVSA